MMATWMFTALSILEVISYGWVMVKDLVMDCLVDWMLKAQLSLPLPLWLFKGVCCSYSGSLPWSVRSWQDLLNHL